MSFPYKAIFVDLDGTLLNSQKQISARSAYCLNSFMQQGVHVIVSTGRSILSAQRVITALHTTGPIITLNGCHIVQHREGLPLVTFYLENSLRDQIVDFAKYVITSRQDEYTIANIIADTTQGFYAINPHHPVLTEFYDHYETKPELLDLDDIPETPLTAFLFLLSDNSKRQSFIEDKKKFLSDDAHLCVFNGWPWIELGSRTTNKGAALKYVCGHLGILPEETIAFGDGQNDVEMLQAAGLGVAMANGDQSVLDVTDARALTNDQDGVAVFLETLMRI
jgi:Cof subfamily protein (haloacid dehalogenase superfamily)